MIGMLECELEASKDRMPHPWSLVKSPDEFWGDLSTHGRRLLKELLEGTMETWRDQYVAVDWHQPAPQRTTCRNGYYTRKRGPTELGPLPEVRVPRCRDKGLTQAMFARLGDPRAALADNVIDLMLSGVSTRRVGQLLDRIIGLPVSAGRVSQLAKRLDALVQDFHRRPIPDDLQYLLLDAIHLKARGVPRLIATALRKSRKRVVLVAYGISKEGIKQILDFRIASSESASAWRQFLLGLYRRGLKGDQLRLITTDGHGGLAAAVEDVWPLVNRQRCWFHKMQNVSAKLKKKDRAKALVGLRAVYAAESRPQALAAYHGWARRWQTLCPQAVRCVEKDLELLLAVFSLPPEHRKMMRTTNGIERRFREVRRRTRSIGTFVDDASIERIIYGLVAYFNDRDAKRVCREFRPTRVAA